MLSLSAGSVVASQLLIGNLEAGSVSSEAEEANEQRKHYTVKGCITTCMMTAR